MTKVVFVCPQCASAKVSQLDEWVFQCLECLNKFTKEQAVVEWR